MNKSMTLAAIAFIAIGCGQPKPTVTQVRHVRAISCREQDWNSYSVVSFQDGNGFVSVYHAGLIPCGTWSASPYWDFDLDEYSTLQNIRAAN